MFFCEAGKHLETIGSNIKDFVCILHGQFTVNFVVVCQILNRATARLQHPDYNLGVQVLNDYLKVVLEPLSQAEFWNHKGLQRPSIPMLLREAIHLNDRSNYASYRSYRGEILFALKKLFSLAQRTWLVWTHPMAQAFTFLGFCMLFWVYTDKL